MTHIPATEVRALTAECARLLREDPDAFTARFGLHVAPGYLAFPEALDALVDTLAAGADPEWNSHLIIDAAIATVVGLGGYYGPPTDGLVEVGYSVAPDHRGRGHATAAVEAWLCRAADAGAHGAVAHTLAEPNASTAVLRRCGFERTGVVPDPEHGEIWRWQRSF